MASSTPHGRDKLAFLLAFVPYLMDKGQVSVQEAARRFGVSETQIRDSVNLIAVSGVPGETSSYQHEDLFDIDWDLLDERDEIAITHLVAIDDSPRFSAREAAALIAGLQYLSSLPEQADRGVLVSLLAKLSRGASGTPSEVAVGSSEVDEYLSVIRDAVSAGVRIEFDYLNSRGELERRAVDPLRIESLDQDWYLRGWDHGRDAARTFRLDRMSTLVATSVPISRRADDVPLGDRLFEPSDTDLSVVVELDSNALPLISDYLTAEPGKPKGEGPTRVTLHLAHTHGLKRLVAGLAGVVTVVEPASARARVADWAQAAIDRYAESDLSSRLPESPR
ncbi:helix-turn-helix transcriptional regulator [Mycetocola zhujimingii]|uniref:WYL domain-containing protein n=1 Tax=Mycetocola zhujimingii TaxID=2079792 RepID=A0A2U1TGA9_9MICO|nr:WYL domain-containing protein [Mycetocola zhujimingii]PWC07896.1 WYL domain-containing protein [Mycetocola zhujimingii]